MSIAHMKTWRIGAVEVTRIVEIWEHVDDIAMIICDATADEVRAVPWLLPHYATPEGKMMMNFQAFLIRAGGRQIMVDTCIGNERQREHPLFCELQTSFLEDLAAIGVSRASVDTVLCTHLHLDHVGWNTMKHQGEWVPTFPNARYLFGRAEMAHWEFLRYHGGHDLRHIEDSVDPVVRAGLAEVVESTYQVSNEVRLEPAPGHTPGHVYVRISSGGQEAVITGDLLHHPMQCAMPHRHAAFDLDKEAGAKTRVEFMHRYEERAALIIGTHFCEPTIGWIVRDGDAWRFEGHR